MFLYSATTGGFYDREIHGDNIPADAVEITAEEHVTLLNGQSSGKRIVADENGFPVLAAPPAIPFDPVPLLEKVRQAREVVLNRLSGIGMAAIIANDATTVQAVLSVRQGLLDITKVATPEVSGSYDTLRAAFMESYAAIVDSAPANVKNAFAEFSL